MVVGMAPGQAGWWKETLSHPPEGCEGPRSRLGTTPACVASAAVICKAAAGDVPVLRAVC